MRTRLYLLSAIILLFCLLTGCAASRTVVLVPDPDGHTGKAEVATTAGKCLLEKPDDITHISDSSSPPEPVSTATKEYISATFSEVLAIEPLPSEKFILFFETGSLKLTEDSQKTISVILDAINRRSALTVTISGHADASGSTLTNDRIAFERAGMVQGMLLQKGVDPKRMTLTSHGKANPAVPTPDGVAEPRNRRVEVVIR